MTVPSADAESFLALTDKIGRERGFGASNYKGSCLRRRIAVRMRARGAPDYDAYARLLDADPAEYERLLDALTINVTKLYRNADAWDAVRDRLLPELWALPATRLRCWVAGCSSGEEAYTLAALWHAFVAARGEGARLDRLRIVATDIDRAQQRRQVAILPERIGRGTEPLAQLKGDIASRPGQMQLQGPGHRDPAIDSLDGVLAHIQLAGLHVTVGFGVGKEDVQFGSQPGAIATRVMPTRSCKQRTGRIGLMQAGVGPVEALVALGGVKPQRPRTIGE